MTKQKQKTKDSVTQRRKVFGALNKVGNGLRKATPYLGMAVAVALPFLASKNKK